MIGNPNNSPLPAGPESTQGGGMNQQPTEIKIRFNGSKPLATYILLGVSVVLFLLQVLSEWLTGVDIPFMLGGKINDAITAGQYWRLFTPMLLHGSILHLALNMYALVILGRSIEYNFGRLRFLALYVAAGFAGNVVSYLLSPNPSIGSSTAIFGLLAAEAVFVYQNRKFYGTRSKSILINAASIAAINLVLGLNPGIDNWGHLGGLLGGILFTWLGGPQWELKGLVPNLEIEDQRTSNHSLTALVITLFIFISIGLASIFLRQ
ncbi:MAG: hypothetical protein C0391_08880 [Anaerolinea sp.]|nr:hypothetical protein [Anaerolinea sp.]